MANKVSIFIKNTEGRIIEFTNSKMALVIACDTHTNWDSALSEPIGKYDIILSDFSNNKAPAWGLGYTLVQHCDDEATARKIVSDCRNLIQKQYERMMMIRVAKKYDLDALTLLKIEMEYHAEENWNIDLKQYFIN